MSLLAFLRWHVAMTFELDLWDYLSPLLNDIFQVANQPWLCVALCLQTLYNQLPLLLMVMGGGGPIFACSDTSWFFSSYNWFRNHITLTEGISDIGHRCHYKSSYLQDSSFEQQDLVIDLDDVV